MNIPQDIFNRIMLYNSHPVADAFKCDYNKIFKYCLKIKEEGYDEEVCSFYNIWKNNYNNIDSLEYEEESELSDGDDEDSYD